MSGAVLDGLLQVIAFEQTVDQAAGEAVTTAHAVASELTAQGFGDRLLAAVFRFDGDEHPVYWIYGFKTGTWWPFVPTGEKQERDNAQELELKAATATPPPPPISRQAFLNQADAPPCHECGSIMVRSAACYKCMNCGATSGCS